MRQALHIFKKDVRHYWREGAAAIALMAAFTWNESIDLAGSTSVAYGTSWGWFGNRFLPGMLEALLPLSWALVIVRVIQGESLVGDRQFWTTRPYEWKSLLSAKVLFILVFVNLPWSIGAMVLLCKAGFPPTHYLVPLLWMQLMMTFFPLLMIAALATVTSNLWHFLLGVLVLALYLIGMVSLSQQIPSSSFSSSFVDSAQSVLLLCTCVAVILWQYVRRDTKVSRWVIASFCILLFLILVGTPYESVVAHQYPPIKNNEQGPVQLGLIRPHVGASADVSENSSDAQKEVSIVIPLSVSGIQRDSIVVMSGMMVHIETPDGEHWKSGWRSPGTYLFPGQTTTQIEFSLKRDLFERVKSLPVRITLSLAYTAYHDRNQRPFIVPQGEFALPDVGLCSTGGGFLRQVRCRVAFRTPYSFLVTADLSNTTCPTLRGESLAQTGALGRDWHQDSDSGPAEFGMNPVGFVNLSLRNYEFDSSVNNGICPGTPLVLSNPEFVRRIGSKMELEGLRLVDYAVKSLNFSEWR